MAFTSSAVTLRWERNNLILTRGTSQLLIKAEDIQNLRGIKDQQPFSDYFLTKALVNREARRVFQAWERKDTALLQKLHQEIIS